MSSASSDCLILDANVGNLGNLERALHAVGADARLSCSAQEIARARSILLPGVAAFRPPREFLRGELEGALRHALERGAWLLGICVGFQLLFESSSEHGQTDGLALLSGHIDRLPASVPLPHIGWNRLVDLASHPFLDGVEQGGYAYFVHSFAPCAGDQDQCLAACRHGRSFPAIAASGRVLGTQFHPEKSGELGLRLLKNFIELSHGTVSGH